MEIIIDRAWQGYDITIWSKKEYYNCFSIPKDDTLICWLNTRINIWPNDTLIMFWKKVGKNDARLKKQRIKYAEARKASAIKIASEKRELEVYYKERDKRLNKS